MLDAAVRSSGQLGALVRMHTLRVDAGRPQLAHRALKSPWTVTAKAQAIQVLTPASIHAEVLLTEVYVWGWHV